MTTFSIKDLGLSDSEGKAYFALLELGTSTIKPIADKANIPRTSIYNFIDRLIQMGLVSKIIVRGRSRFTANDPHQLLELQKQRLKSIESSLPLLLGLFNDKKTKPKINYLEGPTQVSQIVKEETRCKKEALYIWPGGTALKAIGGAKVMNEIDSIRIKRKVWIKTIRFRQKDIRYALSKNGPKYLRDLRWAPPEIDINMGLGIYDTGKVGFFSSPKENFGILIESKEVQELMTVLFRLLWASSSPAKEEDG